MEKRCFACAGSGKILGGGMIIRDCYHCNGNGFISEPDDDIEYLHLKNTESYKDAINKIKSISNDISEEEAERLFDEEFNKQKNTEKIKNKGKNKHG